MRRNKQATKCGSFCEVSPNFISANGQVGGGGDDRFAVTPVVRFHNEPCLHQVREDQLQLSVKREALKQLLGNISPGIHQKNEVQIDPQQPTPKYQQNSVKKLNTKGQNSNLRTQAANKQPEDLVVPLSEEPSSLNGHSGEMIEWWTTEDTVHCRSWFVNRCADFGTFTYLHTGSENSARDSVLAVPAMSQTVFVDLMSKITNISHLEMLDCFDIFDPERTGLLIFEPFLLCIRLLVAYDRLCLSDFFATDSNEVFNLLERCDEYFVSPGRISVEGCFALGRALFRFSDEQLEMAVADFAAELCRDSLTSPHKVDSFNNLEFASFSRLLVGVWENWKVGVCGTFDVDDGAEVADADDECTGDGRLHPAKPGSGWHMLLQLPLPSSIDESFGIPVFVSRAAEDGCPDNDQRRPNQSRTRKLCRTLFKLLTSCGLSFLSCWHLCCQGCRCKCCKSGQRSKTGRVAKQDKYCSSAGEPTKVSTDKVQDPAEHPTPLENLTVNYISRAPNSSLPAGLAASTNFVQAPPTSSSNRIGAAVAGPSSSRSSGKSGRSSRRTSGRRSGRSNNSSKSNSSRRVQGKTENSRSARGSFEMPAVSTHLRKFSGPTLVAAANTGKPVVSSSLSKLPPIGRGRLAKSNQSSARGVATSSACDQPAAGSLSLGTMSNLHLEPSERLPLLVRAEPPTAHRSSSSARNTRSRTYVEE